MSNRLKVIFWLMIFAPTLSMGQKFNLLFDHLNTNNGLNSNYNYFINQGPRGYLWISSIDGLFRFDGNTLDKFHPNNARGKGMIGKNVQSEFFFDKKGRVWFTTYKGVNVYDPDNNIFNGFQIASSSLDTIKENYRLFFLEQNKYLWLRAKDSIFTYNIEDHETLTIGPTKSYGFVVDTLQSGKVNRIYGCLWIGGSGLEMFERGKNGFFKKKRKELKDGKNGNFISDLKLVNGNLWAFANTGLLKIDTSDLEIQESFSPELNDKSVYPIRGGNVIDNLMFSINSKDGIDVFDFEKEIFLERTALFSTSDLSFLSDRSYSGLYRSPDNLIWLSDKNASVVDYAWLTHNHFFNPIAFEGNLSKVIGLTNDTLGNIWCLLDNNHIKVFDQNGVLQLEENIYDEGLLSDGENQTKVTQIKSDSNGGVWLLSSQSLVRVDVATFLSEPVLTVREIRPTAFFNSFDLLKNGDLILTTTDTSVWRIKYLEGDVVVESLKGVESYLASNYQKVIRDINGRTYFSDQSSSLASFKSLKNKFEFEKQYDLGVVVYCAYSHESSDTTWLGTDNGLYFINHITQKAEKVNLPQLPEQADHIYSIVSSGGAKFWLATNNGLLQYDVNSKELYRFTTADGLVSNQFSERSFVENHDGKIWMGTNKGLVVFDPVQIEPYPVAPKVLIQSLKINQEAVSLSYLAQNSLKSNNHRLEFKLAAVNMYKAHLNKMYYRVDGQESDDWIQVPENNIVQLSQLGYDDHKLEIYAVNANNVSGPIKSIVFNVRYPLYLRWWFIVGVLLFALFLIYNVVFFEQKRIYNEKLQKERSDFLAQQKIDQALQEERDRIAREMHDDLGGGLSSINLILKRVQKNPSAPSLLEDLDKVQKHTQKSIASMKEIIWVMNSSYDNLNDFITFLRQEIVQFLDDHQIKCKTILPDNIPSDIIIRGKYRRNLRLVVKEACNNIAKHSNATAVFVYFKIDENLSIILNDNGVGIDLAEKNRRGNGLINMKKSMEEIGGSFEIENNEGTRVLLEIPNINNFRTIKLPKKQSKNDN